MNPPSDTALADLAAAVARKLLGRGAQLITAESCTGGWIAKVCTDLAGSSAWFRGGVVSYANETKVILLGVDPQLLRDEGAVSEATVRAMAVGALQRLGGDISVAVSGVAGPDGGSAEKPVGTVWLAWASRQGDGIVVSTMRELYAGDRESIRRQAVARALRGVAEFP